MINIVSEIADLKNSFTKLAEDKSQYWKEKLHIMDDSVLLVLSVQQKLQSCRCNKDRLTGMLKFIFSSSDDDDGAMSMADFNNSKLFLGASMPPAT
ncbi:hypothetical protein L2E82_39365 [Cichorium intybus]|uniref:Uncharacterized protein n=1 Tax=Cichorium intybus TaxID=13427 RepID=A0ACB9AIZ5_CICIN|nr:hypothetical protein L2E82_39365 [Cichorium intybus]